MMMLVIAVLGGWLICSSDSRSGVWALALGIELCLGLLAFVQIVLTLSGAGR